MLFPESSLCLIDSLCLCAQFYYFFDGLAAVERVKINSKFIALSSRALDSLLADSGNQRKGPLSNRRFRHFSVV